MIVPWGSPSGLRELLSAPFQAWLAEHPLLFWLASHPLWLLAAVVLTLFLLAGLLRAAAGLTEQLWLILLRLPIWLVQWIWRGAFLMLRSPKTNLPPPVPNRLSELMERLETLRQEENELMQELRSLLSSQAKQGQNQ